MGLETIAQVVKAAIVLDLARVKATWKVLDLVRHFVPNGMEFFGCTFGGSFDRVAFDDQWIEIYHLNMAVKSFEDTLPSNSSR